MAEYEEPGMRITSDQLDHDWRNIAIALATAKSRSVGELSATQKQPRKGTNQQAKTRSNSDLVQVDYNANPGRALVREPHFSGL
jgi:hypothetical protein